VNDLANLVIALTDHSTGETTTTGLAYCTNPLTGEREYDALIGLRVHETCMEIAHSLSSIPFRTLPDKVQTAIKREAEEMVFIQDHNPFA
jgi:hypothetical protein